MSAFEIESDEAVHFVELTSGDKLTGIFKFDEDTIRTHIFSYEKVFFIKPENPIFLWAEKNVIVSLHSNIAGPPGTTSHTREPERTIYRQDIISNIAVFGSDKWASSDPVKRVSFTVEHTKGVLKNRAKTKALAKREAAQKDDANLFTETVGGMTIRAYYLARYSLEYDAPTDIWPGFEIEFDNEKTLENYVDYIKYLVQFLSFSLGVRLKPSEIRISRQSHSEMVASIEEQSYPGDHTVRYIWPEVEIDTTDLWVGGSPVIAWDDEELSALRRCVVSWMGRYSEWRNAYVLMMSSFALKGELSANRLITTCKWFEEIPLAKFQDAITENHVSEIASAAAKVAQELGYKPDIKRRISGSLRSIRSEFSRRSIFEVGRPCAGQVWSINLARTCDRRSMSCD